MYSQSVLSSAYFYFCILKSIYCKGQIKLYCGDGRNYIIKCYLFKLSKTYKLEAHGPLQLRQPIISSSLLKPLLSEPTSSCLSQPSKGSTTDKQHGHLRASMASTLPPSFHPPFFSSSLCFFVVLSFFAMENNAKWEIVKKMRNIY